MVLLNGTGRARIFMYHHYTTVFTHEPALREVQKAMRPLLAKIVI